MATFPPAPLPNKINNFAELFFASTKNTVMVPNISPLSASFRTLASIV